MVNVVFLHPDLGIGGAERLVVDAALALKSRGHNVHFVTAHHDPNHCFTETSDGTFPVTCVGDALPRSIFGVGYALCAYLRMIYAAVFLVFFSNIPYDVVVCDLISACIPVLKMKNTKVLFYCHFPDQLLTQRKNFLKRLYRAPIDYLEQVTTGMADRVLVNSKFTASVFRDTFRNLKIVPDVLYPSINFSAFDRKVDDDTFKGIHLKKEVTSVFLSINRYERKKNLSLAIKALGILQNQKEYRNKIHVIMAGGYDERNTENVEHFSELVQEAEEQDLKDHITFIRSFTDNQKNSLLHNCTCLLYTPQHEHFGIVPIEAMYMSRPVIAVNSGGPTETIIHEQTGFLCEPSAEEFANAMKKLVDDHDLAREMGIVGREHVRKMFSFEKFTDQFDRVICELANNSKKEN